MFFIKSKESAVENEDDDEVVKSDSTLQEEQQKCIFIDPEVFEDMKCSNGKI